MKQEKKPGLIVMGLGILSSILALLAVHKSYSMFPDLNIMGWYANFVIPVGAILVGACAGCGYGIGSWVTQTRLTKSTLIVICLVQIAVYFAGRYIEYSSFNPVHPDTGASVPFFVYYDYVVQSMGWLNKDGTPGEPFGLWGYGINFLDVSGFSLAGIFFPAIMMKIPYCSHCQKYMKQTVLTEIPFGVVPRKVKKGDIEESQKLEDEMDEAIKIGNEKLAELTQVMTAGDYSALKNLLSEINNHKELAKKVNAKISIKTVKCNGCHTGYAQPVVVVKNGDQVEESELEKIVLTADLVRYI